MLHVPHLHSTQELAEQQGRAFDLATGFENAQNEIGIAAADIKAGQAEVFFVQLGQEAGERYEHVFTP